MKSLILILFVSLVPLAIAFEESEAMRFMRLGCEKQKLGLGCTNYANFLIKNGRELEADAYFIKGCKLGHQDGCDKKRWEQKEQVQVDYVEPQIAVEPEESAPEMPALEPPTDAPAPTENTITEPTTEVEPELIAKPVEESSENIELEKPSEEVEVKETVEEKQDL